MKEKNIYNEFNKNNVLITINQVTFKSLNKVYGLSSNL